MHAARCEKNRGTKRSTRSVRRVLTSKTGFTAVVIAVAAVLVFAMLPHPVPAITLSTITATPSPPGVGTPVTFTSNASGGTPPLSYAWSFGDGNNSTDTTPSHTYTTAGPYTVSLTVTDSNGLTASTSIPLTVNAAPTALTVTTITPSNSSPTADTPVTFTSNASGGTPPLSYAWSFGDGNNSTDTTPSHTYTTAGPYTVSLTVTDSNGLTASTSIPLTVNAAPEPT